MRRNFWILFLYELRKLLLSRLSLGVFLLILLFGNFVYVRDGAFRGQSEAGRLLDGRLIDDALLTELTDRMQRRADGTMDEEHLFAAEDLAYERIYSWMQYLVFLGRGDLHGGITAEALYAQRSSHIRDIMAEALLTSEEIAYWDALEALVTTPLTYQYAAMPTQFYRDFMSAVMLSMIFCGICLAGVFAGERERRTDVLVLSTRSGRGVLFAAKVFAALTAALLYHAALLAAVQLPQLLIFGPYGWDCALQFVKPFFPYPWTIGQLLQVFYGEYFCAALLSGALMLFLSAAFSTGLTASGTGVGIAFASVLLTVPARFRVLSQLFDLRPTWLLVNGNRPDLRLVRLFGHFYTNYEVAPVLYLLLSCLLIAAACRLWLRRTILHS